MSIPSFKVNYNNLRTELCELGRKYDTDKTPWRNNTSDSRHAHPYTIFYDNLFKNVKDEELVYCEMGILHGSSLRMFAEHLKNAKLIGLEYNQNYIDTFNSSNTDQRITIDFMNIKDEESIYNSLKKCPPIDILIEDTTHEFEDQIRAIKKATPILNEGGILIIEDIFLKENEAKYYDALKDILTEYKNYYFVTLDHKNKISTGWNNDKLLILHKKGTSKFDYFPNVTLITPSCRPKNIETLYKTIDFNKIDKWIIVYDSLKVTQTFQYVGHPKIEEYITTGPGISGNPQRNYAIQLLRDRNYDGFIYFLDDDNTIHPNFWNLYTLIRPGFYYTFDMIRRNDILTGDKCEVNKIDTAMFIVDFKTTGEMKWEDVDKYCADGLYIQRIYKTYPNKHIYVNYIAAQYNSLK